MILVHVPRLFRRDFRHVELGVLQNCEPELPANGVHVSFLIDQLANLPPVPTLRALLADRGHVFAAFLDCTQRAAIFRRNARGKLFAEILRTHRLEDRQMAKRSTSLGAGSRKPLYFWLGFRLWLRAPGGGRGTTPRGSRLQQGFPRSPLELI